MNPKVQARLAGLAIFCHPVLLAFIVFDLVVSPEWPTSAVAYVFELVLAAFLARRFVPWLRDMWPMSTRDAVPDGVENTLDGFRASFAKPVDKGRHTAAGLIGTALSVAGISVIAFFGLLVLSGASVGSGGVELISTALVIVCVAQFVFQGIPMAAVLGRHASRTSRRSRRAVELAGRVLRLEGESMVLTGQARLTRSVPEDSLTIEDSGKRFVVWGSPAELSWLAQRLQAVAPQGSAEDVPEALSRVTARQEA